MTDNRNRGLYNKYKVERVDGKPVGPVFVMEFDDPNCWPALRAYADHVADEYPLLARDVRATVGRHESAHWKGEHVGRSFPGRYHLEESCPCPQLPCGLVDISKAIEIDCPEHNPIHAKTFRNSHPASRCPGVRDD